MKLEQNEPSLLFTKTELPDIFFTEYLSQSKGNYIKVYLYMYFLSKHNKDIKLNDLSKKIAIDLKEIQEAIKYWEDLGVITKKTSGYIFNDLQEIELHKLYKPRISSTPEDAAKNSKNQYRAKAIENINNVYFQGMMSQSWYLDIDMWFKKYGFDEQVMIALFNYCFNKSALHRNYVRAVADAWSKNNIKTYNDLDLYYQQQEKLNTIKKAIVKKLGYNRFLTQYEEAYIEKWIMDYGFGLDVIEIALKKTTSKANPNFDYLDKLLTDWKERNLRTATEVQQFLIDMKQKNKDIKALDKKTKYNNYEQRTYNNLDDLFANKKKA